MRLLSYVWWDVCCVNGFIGSWWGSFRLVRCRVGRKLWLPKKIMATATVSAQVSKFWFRSVIPGIKFSHHILCSCAKTLHVKWISFRRQHLGFLISIGDIRSSVTDPPTSSVLPSLQCIVNHWVFWCTISLKKAPKGVHVCPLKHQTKIVPVVNLVLLNVYIRHCYTALTIDAQELLHRVVNSVTTSPPSPF